MIPRAVARQPSLSVEFSRQEHWSGLQCPSSGDFPNPGIKLVSLMSPALAVWFFNFTTSTTWGALYICVYVYIIRKSWRRKWQPTPVFFPGESYGQRSLAATVRGVTKSQTRLSTQCSPADVQPPHFMLRFLRRVDCVQLFYSLRLFACMSFSQSIKMQRQTSHSVAH